MHASSRRRAVTGAAVLAAAVSIAGCDVTSIDLGDFNSDARPDVAAAMIGSQGESDQVVIMGNQGSADFDRVNSLSTPGDPTGVSVGRIRTLPGNHEDDPDEPVAYANGLGTLDPDQLALLRDIAVANTDTDNVSVFLGNGDNTFGSRIDVPVGDEPVSTALALMNAGRNPDIVVANRGDDNVQVLLGDGSGGFTSRPPVPAGNAPFQVLVADLDRDSRSDVVVANDDGVRILRGTGGGFLAQGPSYALEDVRGITLGDFDRDGSLDLAATNSDGGAPVVTLLPGAESGTRFSLARARSFPTGVEGYEIALGRIGDAEDGDLAVVTANRDDNSVSVLRQVGNGFTLGAPTHYDVEGEPRGLVFDDINDDERFDILVGRRSTSDSYLTVLLGRANGTFAAPQHHELTP